MTEKGILLASSGEYKLSENFLYWSRSQYEDISSWKSRVRHASQMLEFGKLISEQDWPEVVEFMDKYFGKMAQDPEKFLLDLLTETPSVKGMLRRVAWKASDIEMEKVSYLSNKDCVYISLGLEYAAGEDSGLEYAVFNPDLPGYYIMSSSHGEVLERSQRP